MTRLTILLPCFNESDRLPRALRSFLDHLPADPDEAEILIVDDGSVDRTGEVAHAVAGRDPRVRVVRRAINHGKGFAVRLGMLAARGDRIVFTDGDGSYGPGQVDQILRALDRAPVAIGIRQVGAAGESISRRLASRTFNTATRAILSLPHDDTQCGLKGFRRDAAVAIFGRARVDGFAFDAEALYIARRLGLEVAEVPVVAEVRDGSKVRLAVDALRMLRHMWQIRRAATAGVYDQAPHWQPGTATDSAQPS